MWQGRRFKTKDYSEWAEELLLLLHDFKVINGEKLFIKIEFGFSNKASDLDNPVKGFMDTLQKKYNFDDKYAYSYFQHKVITKKGDEYIKYEISSYEEHKLANPSLYTFKCDELA